jgi:nucleoside-diphosphate-sugar epimerase
MQKVKPHLFVLGSTGFIGNELVRQAMNEGLSVSALVRSQDKAAAFASLGVQVVIGDAENPSNWIGKAAGCDVIIDLLQPQLPGRISIQAIERIAAMRLAMTGGILTEPRRLPLGQRPLLLSVSGLDDLAPDDRGNVDDKAALQTELSGFARIGVPARRCIEQSGIDAAYAYLGTVYGPGKAFETKIFPDLAAGRLRLPGTAANRMAVVHVEDAARALLHIAKLGVARTVKRSFVVADGKAATLVEFMAFAAKCLGGPQPKSVPPALARIFAGKALFETITRDIAAHPKDLLDTGFRFKYPSYREGLPASIQELGLGRTTAGKNFLDRRASLVSLTILALGAFLGVNLLSFPLSVHYMTHLAGGAPILDLRLSYTPAAAYDLFNGLGQTGRHAYLAELWTVDLVLPILFGLFLSAVMRRGKLRGWSWLPLLGSACDYTENLLITLLLLRYPERMEMTVYVASGLTAIKQALYASGVILSVAGFLLPRRKDGSGGSVNYPNVNATGLK